MLGAAVSDTRFPGESLATIRVQTTSVTGQENVDRLEEVMTTSAPNFLRSFRGRPVTIASPTDARGAPQP